MSRILVVLAALIAALACASTARAAIPQATVSIGGATVDPSLLSGTETLLGGGPTLIYDGFGLNPPTLIAAPGSAVTITTDMTVETVRVWLGSTALAVTATGERTYTATLPADLALPLKLEVGLDATTATHRVTSGWVLILAAPPPDPVPIPTVVLGPVAEGVAAPRISAPVRLDGRRLAVTLTCATRCSGTLTLKTPSLRVARLAYRGSGTQRVTLRAAVLRHLERHGIRRLHAVLTPTGGRPIATTLRLART